MHNAGMPRSITIRDVPDETGDELASRAAATGRSLQEYLRSMLIEVTSRPDPEVLMARVRERKARAGTYLRPDTILELRDADRK